METGRRLASVVTFALVLGLTGVAHAASMPLHNTDATYTVNTVLDTGTETWYSDGAEHFWKANNGAVVSAGNGVANAGRIFPGINGQGSGELTLTSDAGAPGTFLLDGHHSADSVLGRLGHTSNTGVLNITGGVSVSMLNRLRYSSTIGATQELNVLDGSLDLTDPGFSFHREGNANLLHTVGADGSIVVDALISNAAGFSAWAGNPAVTVAADTGLSLEFTQAGGDTTITAAPAGPPPSSPTPLIEYLGGATGHRADGPYTVGNLIEVGSDDLLITHLGAQDDGLSGPDGNGFFAGGVDVGLWSADGSALLASARVLSGDPLTGTYRYQELATPITLSANTQYLIGARVGGGIEWFEDNSAGAAVFAGNEVTLIQNRYATGSVLAPPLSDGAQTVGRWGPANALVAPPAPQGDIPEPATLAMLALGAAGLGGYVRRRKK